MATLSAINNLSVDGQGITQTAKQGLSTGAFSDAYTGLTITGLVKQLKSQLATATIITAWDSSVDTPTSFSYFHLWTDQTLKVQVLTSATNFILKIGAYLPFSFGGFNSLLAAANATPITGGAEPTTTAIAKIILGNYSGSTANYVLTVIL